MGLLPSECQPTHKLKLPCRKRHGVISTVRLRVFEIRDAVANRLARHQNSKIRRSFAAQLARRHELASPSRNSFSEAPVAEPAPGAPCGESIHFPWHIHEQKGPAYVVRVLLAPHASCNAQIFSCTIDKNHRKPPKLVKPSRAPYCVVAEVHVAFNQELMSEVLFRTMSLC